MKERIADENDENDAGVAKQQKPAVNTEKNPPAKATKSTKSTSNTVPLKQALQNVRSFEILFASIFDFFSLSSI